MIRRPPRSPLFPCTTLFRSKELRISEGGLWRRNRAVPLERLQAVEVVQPLLARLTGLAELRLEVVGGGKTEAPLAYLTVPEAAALRERLLILAGRLRGNGPAPGVVPATAGLTVDHAAPARLLALHRVVNRDVVISQLLTPQAWAVPFALAFIVLQTVLD